MKSTDIVLVIDRSGSMTAIKRDAEGALNHFIEMQKELPGKATVKAVQFDGQYEELFGPVAIEEAPEVVISPRGTTALLDAIGKTVVDYSGKADKVLFVIITDGEENSSKEWTTEAIRKLVGDSKKKGYEFMFLAANQDAVLTGSNMGFKRASSLTFATNAEALQNTSDAMASYATAYRSGIAPEFTDEQRTRSGLTD